MIDLVNLYRGATLRWGDFGNDGLRWVFGRPPRKQTAKKISKTRRAPNTHGKAADKFRGILELRQDGITNHSF